MKRSLLGIPVLVAALAGRAEAPTVPVSPTVAGIAAGRVEQLEKALEVASR